MIANATAGGTMLSDALGRGPSAGSRPAKIISGSILVFGVAVTLIFQASPVQLIVVAQALVSSRPGARTTVIVRVPARVAPEG